MHIDAICETNGKGWLIWAAQCPGAFARGATENEALAKLPGDVRRFLRWAGEPAGDITVTPGAPIESGLHTEDGSVPENSLPAFRAAAEAGYAVEMDVHLTADDQLVVFHDDTLERMCGVPGVIDDFTLAELRALRLGDTDCVIPTFAEALEALGGRVPLLLEVKRGHNNRRLCALTLAALRTYGGPYCVESFDPTIVAWFRRNAPDILRGQLSQPPKDYGKALNKHAAAIVGNVLTNVIARPQFIAYKIGPKPLSVRLCEAMGAARAGWTSRAWTHERDYDIVIFEHYRPCAWFRADI